MIREYETIRLLLFLALSSFAAEGVSARPAMNATLPVKKQTSVASLPRGFESGMHNIGNVWNTVTNIGITGDPSGVSSSMEWPAGSQVHYLWSGELWIGAIVDGEKLCSHPDIDRSEFVPVEGARLLFGPGKSIRDHQAVYTDIEYQRGHTPLGVEVHERGLTWNLAEYDDFIIFEYQIINVGDKILKDVFIGWMYDYDISRYLDLSDSYYIDDIVDYDGFDGEETDTDMVDWVDPHDIDDDGLTGYDEWGFPYAFPMEQRGVPGNPNYDPGKVEPDGLYDEWSVILQENGPVLHWQTAKNPANAPAGAVAEVGGEILRGWLIPRNCSIMYDADYPQTAENDIGERNSVQPTPGCAGGRLLYSDIIKSRDVFPYLSTPEDTLMRPFAHQWWTWDIGLIPFDDIGKYDYLSAQHSSSTRLGKHYHFLPSPLDLNGPTFDYRWLMSTGPFLNFAPGDTISVVYATGIGTGLAGIREVMDRALRAYYAGSRVSDPIKPSAPEEDIHYLLAFPPPIPDLTYTALDRGARLVWDNAAEFSVDEMLGIADFSGYKIYRTAFDLNHWEMIAAFDNTDEMVLVRDSQGQIINGKRDPETGLLIPFDDSKWSEIENIHLVGVDLPPVVNTFDDLGGPFLGRVIAAPINGLPYYYAVVAFDSDKPAAGKRPEIVSHESAKSNYMKDPVTGQPVAVFPGMNYSEQIVPDFDLKRIKVVPNPFKGSSLLEARYEEILRFINLPPACKISIFTMNGDLIETLYHDSGTDSEEWDLITRNRQRVVSGLYLFVVENNQPDYDKFIGKFVVIR